MTGNEIKERPIYFRQPSADAMVRSVLAGTKTQMRLPIIPQPKPYRGGPFIGKCPFGKPGDRLWMQECWAVDVSYDSYAGGLTKHVVDVAYRAGGGFAFEDERGVWRPSIHMPRWASRTKLVVKRAWRDRIQDISPHDAVKEGVHLPYDCPHRDDCALPGSVGVGSYDDDLAAACGGRGWHECRCAVEAFRRQWDFIYAAKGYGFGDNPWVWGCEFEWALKGH